jgi:hypothetical protein
MKEFSDKNGVVFHEGDIIVFPDGTCKTVLLTNNNELLMEADNADDIDFVPDMENMTLFEELSLSILGCVQFNKSREYTGYTLELKRIVDDILFTSNFFDSALQELAVKRFKEKYPDKV